MECIVFDTSDDERSSYVTVPLSSITKIKTSSRDADDWTLIISYGDGQSWVVSFDTEAEMVREYDYLIRLLDWTIAKLYR